MTSSLVVVLTSARTQADVNSTWVRDTSNPREQSLFLSRVFKDLASGTENGSFTLQSSANAPVNASGTVTLTNASIAAGNTVTVAGVVFTAETSGATGAQFNIGGTATITASNMVAAINSDTSINKLVLASSNAGVVTITSLVPGAIGNFLTLATSNSTGFGLSAATLASGSGGSETVAVTYSRGL